MELEGSASPDEATGARYLSTFTVEMYQCVIQNQRNEKMGDNREHVEGLVHDFDEMSSTTATTLERWLTWCHGVGGGKP